jgi:hypothetical protein
MTMARNWKDGWAHLADAGLLGRGPGARASCSGFWPRCVPTDWPRSAKRTVWIKAR